MSSSSQGARIPCVGRARSGRNTTEGYGYDSTRARGASPSSDGDDSMQPDAAAEPANAAGSEGSFSRLTHAAEFYASQAATQAAGLFSYKKTGDEKSQEVLADGAGLPVNDVAATEPANAAGSEGSFSRLTHAAEFYASQAATQAAGLFSYKKTGDEKSQEPNEPDSPKASDAAEAANAAASEGSFSRLTHAAEFYASQAATQAAGLFSYKKTDEGQEAAEILGSDGSFARLTHAAVGPLWPTDLAAAAGLFASTASAERQEAPENSHPGHESPLAHAAEVLLAPDQELHHEAFAAEADADTHAPDVVAKIEEPSLEAAETSETYEKPAAKDSEESDAPEEREILQSPVLQEPHEPLPGEVMEDVTPAQTTILSTSSVQKDERSEKAKVEAEKIPKELEVSCEAPTAAPASPSADATTSFTRLTHAAEFYAAQAATHAAEFFLYKKDEKSGPGSPETPAAPAQAAETSAEDVTEGSFSRMTNAAGALASQAATQAAEFFGKSEDAQGGRKRAGQRRQLFGSGLESLHISEGVERCRLDRRSEALEALDNPWRTRSLHVARHQLGAHKVFARCRTLLALEEIKGKLRCWRCGQEILAELDAVEAHEEFCSRPMQQLLEAADLLAGDAPESLDPPGSEVKAEAAEAAGDADAPPSSTSPSSLLAWTTPGVNALVGLKESVKDTSSHMVHRAYRAAGSLGGSKQEGEVQKPLTPDLDPVQVYGRIEDTVETLVLLVLEPVLKGIPSLGILPVRIEARRSVGEHGSPQAAVKALLAKAEAEDAESGMSQRFIRKVSELLVMRFLPVVGAGAFLSYTIYARLRLAALVAEMNGHDSEDPEVQGLLFFSILPGGETHPDVDQSPPATLETPGG
ncbi:unnamed protein product, partial [Cladocopium goreaui]